MCSHPTLLPRSSLSTLSMTSVPTVAANSFKLRHYMCTDSDTLTNIPLPFDVPTCAQSFKVYSYSGSKEPEANFEVHTGTLFKRL